MAINKFKKLFIVLSILFFGLMAVDVVQTVATDTSVAEAIFNNKAVDSSKANSNTEAKNLIEKIFSFANVFAGIVLAVSIIMVIVGGLRYITSNGDQKMAEQGKSVIMYSAIGVIVALSAFALGRFFQGFAVGGK